jgi:hypothetical protein
VPRNRRLVMTRVAVLVSCALGCVTYVGTAGATPKPSFTGASVEFVNTGERPLVFEPVIAISFAETKAGKGDETIRYLTSFEGAITYTCNGVPGSRSDDLNSSETTYQTWLTVDKHGTVSISGWDESIKLPSTLRLINCAGTLILTSVVFSHVTITDTAHDISIEVPGTYGYGL